LNLSQIKVSTAQRRTVTVDITDKLGADEPVVLSFQEPNAPALFAIGGLAQAVRKKNPDWPDILCQSVALMAVSHTAPDCGDIDPLQWYSHLAEADAALFFYILTEYNAALPTVSAPVESVAAAKNE